MAGYGLPAYALRYEELNVGGTIASSKKKICWYMSFTEEPEEHLVALVHSKLSGKKQIFADGAIVYTTSEASMSDWHHNLSLDGHRITVMISGSVAADQPYGLMVDGVSFTALPRTSIDQLKAKHKASQGTVSSASHSPEKRANLSEFVGASATGTSASVRAAQSSRSTAAGDFQWIGDGSTSRASGASKPSATFAAKSAPQHAAAPAAASGGTFDPFGEDQGDADPFGAAPAPAPAPTPAPVPAPAPADVDPFGTGPAPSAGGVDDLFSAPTQTSTTAASSAAMEADFFSTGSAPTPSTAPAPAPAFDPFAGSAAAPSAAGTAKPGLTSQASAGTAGSTAAETPTMGGLVDLDNLGFGGGKGHQTHTATGHHVGPGQAPKRQSLAQMAAASSHSTTPAASQGPMPGNVFDMFDAPAPAPAPAPAAGPAFDPFA